MRTMPAVVVVVLALSLSGCASALVSSVITSEADQRLIDLIRETGAVPDDQSGVVGMVLDGNGTVASVVYGGPAYLAEIRPGDTAVALDGQQLVGVPGSMVRLRVESGGAAREVEIVRVPWWVVFDAPAPPDAQVTTPGG
jgi:S1-C subfamily serine protease